MKIQINHTLRFIICIGFFTCRTFEAAGQVLSAETADIPLDINIITIPFKIRPGLREFPCQLNTTMSVALYLGKRKELLHGGYGYGLFAGIGSVTMNPYVARQEIDYEYEGFVSSAGVAGIYDAKRFNVGLAIGIDHLMDKNREKWLYHHQPWIGVLFGINLN